MIVLHTGLAHRDLCMDNRRLRSRYTSSRMFHHTCTHVFAVSLKHAAPHLAWICMFYCRAQQEGYSMWSTAVAAATAATTPGCPTGLAAVGINRSSVTLTWQPPSSDGGSQVLAYQVGHPLQQLQHSTV